jgi:hypothetical protein
MSMSNVKTELINNLKNIPGRSIPRKIVVIECDDWGGIRTPSAEVYRQLVNRGLVDEKCRYRLDTIATSEDLEQLYHTLESVEDRSGNPAVMTSVSNVANPDFEKIRQSGFMEYHFEPYTETLMKYGRGAEVMELWKKGMEKGIFVPELHGREHLTVQIWLQKLREGHQDLLYAFEQGFVSVNIDEMIEEANGFRAEFFFSSREQVQFLENSISSGVSLFKELFGYLPRVFVPSNAVFHPVFESKLAESGVRYLNVWHLNPVPDENGKLKMKYYRNGKTASSGLTYYVRNCAFEPSEEDYGGIESTLKQIRAAFRWGKPAIISTHRVNFVGGIDPANREYGLSELKKLLKKVKERWPEAEFMSSADMFKVLYPNR